MVLTSRKGEKFLTPPEIANPPQPMRTRPWSSNLRSSSVIPQAMGWNRLYLKYCNCKAGRLSRTDFFRTEKANLRAGIVHSVLCSLKRFVPIRSVLLLSLLRKNCLPYHCPGPKSLLARRFESLQQTPSGNRYPL